MFESLESRQFMSATMITDGTSNTVATAPTAVEADACPLRSVRKAGGEQQAYLELKLENCMISNYSIG